MDGFARLLADVAGEAGLPSDSAFLGNRVSDVLPGFFRATKRWDLLVVHRSRLVAAIEMKSQTGPSYGNNLNNRVEEAVGSAADFWTAYREAAFGNAPRPWLGYVFAFEESPASTKPVRIDEPHSPALPAFQQASYIDRARLLCERLVLERSYDAAWFILTKRDGTYHEPSKMLSGSGFVAALSAQVRTAFTG